MLQRAKSAARAQRIFISYLLQLIIASFRLNSDASLWSSLLQTASDSRFADKWSSVASPVDTATTGGKTACAKRGYPPAQMSPGYNSKLPVRGFDLHQPEPKN
jgi:hypothetical protein